ncbi:peptidoglycan-binding domain-containing protein [Pelagovum pacificum]|uniref:Peptidoglycan-binding protein n=1 Tax=Pelagovum pacificum TaxID=2588711 RepID=A0A5C5GEM4_9RHOB|nr:peptidoglycan-binding domain-containing protein [Pelagovum pacificum]QQA44376.1 hypothetical protein I8N54_07335 [Pelagovum pacificum]TNY32507.1 peptidoglycan-binding protein [Pelagovum pacificum]
MRRYLIVVTLLAWAAPAAAQELRTEFYALSRQDRQALQEQLVTRGLYASTVDGLWGPGTAAAVDQARATLAYPGFAENAREAGIVNEIEIIRIYLESALMEASSASLRPRS